MKIKSLFFVVIGLFLSFSANAEFYVSGGFGISKNTGNIYKSFSKESYRSSAVYSAAFGYDLPFIDIVRVEGEFLHNRSKITNDRGNVDMNALMANGYVDIPLLIPMITPYVGAGIGYGRLEDTNVMPMQLMLGLDAEVFVIPIVASAEYRFMQTNREAKSANEKDKYYAHMFMVKLRYEF